MTERVSRISSHFVITELAAFPFASESALRNPLTHLCPQLNGNTALLWRGAEQTILGAVPSLSLDEFVARRDALWFQPGHGREREWDRTPDSLPLLDILQHLARRTLEVRGSVARPRLSKGEFVGHGDYTAQHARGFWKWLRLAMPPDLLLAGLGSGVLDIETLTPALDRRLRDKGFAEVHLHYGAGLDFSDLWAATCSTLFDAKLDPQKDFASPGAALGEGRDFADWLLRACLARYLMAGYLARSQGQSFSTYVENCPDGPLSELGLGARLLVRDAMSELRRGVLETEHRVQRFFGLRQAFMAIRLSYGGMPSRPEDAIDPVGDWSALRERPLVGDEQREQILPTGHARKTELDFLTRAFAHLESESDGDDGWFAQCLWQSVRVRCLFYRHVTQRPLTPGLPWFLRTFKRMSPSKRHLEERTIMRIAGCTSGARRGLRSLELRTAPSADVSWILELKKAAEAQLRSEEENPEGVLEVGLVLHLGRDRGDGMVEGRPSARQLGGHADPSRKKHAHGARYGEWYREKKRKIFAFAAVLRHWPESLEIIRGVDLCADEAGIPTWVVKPLFRYLHEVARNTALAHARVGHPALELRNTIHAGEDWLHLLGGLRRIHEAHEHFEMRAGDRFGHGLALAVEPMRWSEECGPIAMPRELRLFDLAWVWGLRDRVDFSTTAIEAELRQLMQDLFEFEREGADAWLAHAFVEALHDERVLHRVGYPSFVDDRDSSPAVDERGSRPAVDDIVRRYLVDVRCFLRGRTIIHVDPCREGEMVTAVQDWLRRELDATGIVIEVNPSSNFLTQQLSNMRDHPVWQLHKGRHEGLPELPVVIGSDDPLPFATTLPEEYQLMHDALVLSGRFTNSEADRWLDEARRNSMTYRWTLPEHEGRAAAEGYLRTQGDVDLPP